MSLSQYVSIWHMLNVFWINLDKPSFCSDSQSTAVWISNHFIEYHGWEVI